MILTNAIIALSIIVVILLIVAVIVYANNNGDANEIIDRSKYINKTGEHNGD